MNERIFMQLKESGNHHFYFALILSRNYKFAKAIATMEIALQKFKNELTARQIQDGPKFIEQWKASL